ncbi:hypothetical protein AB0H49_07530 [Nocardia sp. NPDC050713]|uniref:hypothetical protein n=1 Tax=Nocardia sp. NPDC050713 TaxID=3154511 RepID=UPI003401C9D2
MVEAQCSRRGQCCPWQGSRLGAAALAAILLALRLDIRPGRAAGQAAAARCALLPSLTAVLGLAIAPALVVTRGERRATTRRSAEVTSAGTACCSS